MKLAYTAVLTAATIAVACSEPVPPPVWQAVPVVTRDIVVSASAAGVIEPIQTVEVKSKASGEITEVAVETGDEVTPGALLVRVDPRVPRNAMTQAEADLEVAQAQLDNAQSQLERAEALHRTQSITEQEFENARLTAANARAQLVRAQRQLEDARIAYEDTEVRAAIPGVIISRTVEVGSVIASATSNVGGGAVLMTMANLDTVQIRALVDETDIGKIGAGLPVTIGVEAFPNRPFRGRVLKIEPQATVQQNVTMFPVLVRIENTDGLLKPGMNAEVEFHIGSREGATAVANAALRTQADLASAAEVLGLSLETVNQQIASASAAGAPDSGAPAAPADQATITLMGRVVQLPAGTDPGVARSLERKLSNARGPEVFQSLTPEERQVMQSLRQQMGGPGGPGGSGGNGRRAGGEYQFGGQYIVFALRNGQPTAIPIRTGLTDLDYSEVVEGGLAPGDTVLILPSSSLLASQQEFQNRMNQMRGNSGLPVSRSR